MDYNLTSRDVITGTFSTSDNPLLYPFGSLKINTSSVLGFPTTTSDTKYCANNAYTHTFTLSSLNELRVIAQRQNHKQAYPAASAPTASQLGANVPSDDPTGPPRLGFIGSNLNIGFSPQGPINETDNTYAFYDNLSWVAGNYSMKFGFYFSPYQNNTVYEFYVNGEYSFYGPGSIGSGVDLADFLMGLPDELLQFGKAPSNIRSHQYAGFAQNA